MPESLAGGGIMNWEFAFVEPEEYLRITARGVYHPVPHLQMMKETVTHLNWKPGTPVLLDVRKLDYSQTNLIELEQSSRDMFVYDNFIGSSKIAFLTASINDLNVIRQFELITAEDVSAWMQVFLDENQALRWLSAYRTVNPENSLSQHLT